MVNKKQRVPSLDIFIMKVQIKQFNRQGNNIQIMTMLNILSGLLTHGLI